MNPNHQSGDWQQVKSAFQRIWGYPEFRPPQGEIVRILLEKQDGLIVMPTGGGKSICFQLPALLQDGLTVVISPLVALMENQVQELKAKQLPADLLHSELEPIKRRQILAKLEKQQLRLLYLSPETLLSPPVWDRLIQPGLKVNGLILDEAHCLVQWGDTFRPAYRRLGAVRPALLANKPQGTKIAIAAFTATADTPAQKTIRQVLQLQKPEVFLLNPYRDNLNLKVQINWTPRGRKQKLFNFIKNHPKQAGLVYVRTRRDSESLAQWLEEEGFKTAAYHAGLSPDERRYTERNWLEDRLQFVVCTSAFGMGINKPNVRWVIHYHAPILLSEYVQEIGRAGRDGKPAEALTLISELTGWLDPEDKQRQQYFINQAKQQYTKAQQFAKRLPPTGEINAIEREFVGSAIALSILHSNGQLTWDDPFHYTIAAEKRSPTSPPFLAAQLMEQYLKTNECRWKFLLSAFGFPPSTPHYRCNHCDNCSR